MKILIVVAIEVVYAITVLFVSILMSGAIFVLVNMCLDHIVPSINQILHLNLNPFQMGTLVGLVVAMLKISVK